MIKKYVKTVIGKVEVPIHYIDEKKYHSAEQVVVELGTGDVRVIFVEAGNTLSFIPNPDKNSKRGEIKENYEKSTPPAVIKFGDSQSIGNLINALLRMERKMLEQEMSK